MSGPRTARRFARPLALASAALIALVAVRFAGKAEPVQAGSAQEPAPAAEQTVISMQARRFHSDFYVLPVGATVTWSNDETVARERHDIQANDGSFASPVLRPGETWTYTFAQEGYYAYYCSLHQNMEAAILIVPPDESN